MKNRLGIVLAVVGAVAMVLGALSATVWRASNSVTMTAPRPTLPAVVSAPGVLAMLDGEVEVTAAAESAEDPVELVVAPLVEIEAWLAGSPHQQITGAQTWETLKVVEQLAAEGATETVPSLQEVDGWPTLETGTGEVTATVTPGEIETGLIAVTDGTAPAPEVSLSWRRDVSTPWLWPGVIGGAIALGVGVVLLVQDRKEQQEREARRARRSSAMDETSVLPAFDGTPIVDADGEPVLSRRARRLAAERKAKQSRWKWLSRASQPNPSEPNPSELNAREPKEEGR